MDGVIANFRKSLLHKDGQHSQTRAAALLEILKIIMGGDGDDKQIDGGPTLADLLEAQGEEFLGDDRPFRSDVIGMLALYMIVHEIALGTTYLKPMALT